MVDRCYDRIDEHAPLQELEPRNGTKSEKFNLNMVGCGDEQPRSVVCPRLSRVNHSCDFNASHVYIHEHNVKVLFAEKAIRSGEEISFAYALFCDQGTPMSGELARSLLEVKWGIQCPADCLCRDNAMAAKVAQTRQLDQQILMKGATGGIETALDCVRSLLTLYEEMPPRAISRMRTLYDGFQVANARRKYQRRAKAFIKEALEIALRIGLTADAERCREYVKNPSAHNSFGIADALM